jgi:PTS system nitrogen regulatory IIA component
VPHQVFSLEEVAEYLHIAREDVQRLVRSREIPFERMGERYVFRRKDIDAWASQRILGLNKRDLSSYHKTSSANTKVFSEGDATIPELMKPSFVNPRLMSKTKASIIRDMAALADATDLVNYPDEFLQSILERERLCTTALAGGFALLHPEHHDPYMFEDSFIAFGRSVRPVPFGSPDGGTTDLFFLLCCQNDKLHLHVLARLCMICHQTSALYDVRQARTAEEIVDALARAEREVVKLDRSRR